MRAVLMAGGRGTRMLPYTTILPKPLLPVGHRPILAILMEQLAASGVTRIDLCLGYLGELIRAYIAETPLALEGVEIVLHTEREPLGTAGALRSIPGLDEPFLLLNGDVLTSLDVRDLMRTHRDSGAALTVTFQLRETTIGSGVLQLDGGRVTSYVEKPVLRHDVSLGIYALEPRALPHLPTGYADVPDLVHALLDAGEAVHGHPFLGSWFDIGTPSDHELAVAELEVNPERYGLGRRPPPA